MTTVFKNIFWFFLTIFFACNRINKIDDDFIKQQVLNKCFWITDSIQWELPPTFPDDTVFPKVYYGYGKIYYFITDSSFRIVSSYLQKENDTIIFCTEPEESLFEGTWKIENSKIILINHLVHQNFLPQLTNEKTGKVDIEATIKHYTKIHYDTLLFNSGYLVCHNFRLKPTIITSDTSNTFYKLFYENWQSYKKCFKRDLVEGSLP